MSIYNQINSNRKRSFIIMLFFIIFVSTIVYLLGKFVGDGFMWFGLGLIFSGFSVLSSYYWGDRIVLTMSGARPASKDRDFNLFTVTENLSIATGLTMPKLYIIEDTAPNAFATGRDPKNATICVTRGLTEKLNRTELEGVIAHEMSHVKNYDTRLMSIVAVLVGTVVFLSDWFMRSLWWRGSRRDNNRRISSLAILIGIILAVISPIIATLIQLAISRRREFLADAQAALITRYPDGLAQALEKISKDKEVLEVANNATAHLFIINPFKDKNFSSWFTSLFDTHPSVEERIKILRSM